MNPGGRMGPGYILETDRDNNILYQVMRSATSEAERLADSLERQRMMDLVREFVIRYLREKDPQMAQVEKRLENVDLNPYLKEEMINTGLGSKSYNISRKREQKDSITWNCSPMTRPRKMLTCV